MAATLIPERRFLLGLVAVLSLALALDDQFLLHERVLPNTFGTSEEIVVALYAVAGVGIVFSVLREGGIQLAYGLGPPVFFLVGSVLADMEPFGIESSYATEDLLKVAGFAAWLAYWVYYVRLRLKLGLTQA